MVQLEQNIRWIAEVEEDIEALDIIWYCTLKLVNLKDTNRHDKLLQVKHTRNFFNKNSAERQKLVSERIKK